jgi:hypothetical protein
MRGLTPVERKILIESFPTDVHDNMTDAEEVIAIELVARGLMHAWREDDPGDPDRYWVFYETTPLGKKVLELDALVRSVTAGGGR